MATWRDRPSVASPSGRASVGDAHLVVWTNDGKLYVSGNTGSQPDFLTWALAPQLTWVDSLSTTQAVGASAGNHVTAVWTKEGKLWVFGYPYGMNKPDNVVGTESETDNVVGAYATSTRDVVCWTNEGKLYHFRHPDNFIFGGSTLASADIKLDEAWARWLDENQQRRGGNVGQKIIGVCEVIYEDMSWVVRDHSLCLLAWTEEGQLLVQPNQHPVESIVDSLEEEGEGEDEDYQEYEEFWIREKVIGASGVNYKGTGRADVAVWTKFGKLFVLHTTLTSSGFSVDSERSYIHIEGGEKVKQACAYHDQKKDTLKVILTVILTETGKLYHQQSFLKGKWVRSELDRPKRIFPSQMALDMPAFDGVACRNGRIVAWTTTGYLFTFEADLRQDHWYVGENGKPTLGVGMPMRAPFHRLPYKEGIAAMYSQWTGDGTSEDEKAPLRSPFPQNVPV